MGISAILLIMIALYLLFCISSIMIVYGSPIDVLDVTLKVSSFGLVLFFGCMLSLSVGIFFGIIFKICLVLLWFPYRFYVLDGS